MKIEETPPEIKRYSLQWRGSFDHSVCAGLEEFKYGEWVRWEDVREELTRLRTELIETKAMLQVERRWGGGGVKYTDIAVGNWFVQRAIQEGKPRTQMEIHKLVYFAHASFLVLKGKSPIEVEFKALSFGPVATHLRIYTQGWGKNPITKLFHTPAGNASLQIPVVDPKDQETHKILEDVWKSLSCYDAIQLSNISHAKGGPWDVLYEKGREEKVIPDHMIKTFYQDKVV